MTSSKPDASTSDSVSHMDPHPMIPGVGADIGTDHEEQLSSVTEDPEESVGPEKKLGKAPFLSGSSLEDSQDSDYDSPNAVAEIEGEIPGSELGDNDQEPDDSGATSLPSVVFMIPFPAPVKGHRSKKTSPFLLYTPPRSHYTQPPKDETGKRPKEKFFKKMVRHYQQEVRFGEQLKRKEITKTGPMERFHKARASCIRGASAVTKWLPSPCVETLARLPPARKLGEVIILLPVFSSNPPPEGEALVEDQPYQPTPDDLRHDISVLFRRTRKRVIIRLIAAGCFLPIAAGIDFWAPVFFVEITLAYAAFQVYGLRKINALTKSKKAKKPNKGKKSKKQLSEKKVVGGAPAPGEDTSETDGLLANAADDSATEDVDSGALVDRFLVTPADDAIFKPLVPLLYNICSRIDPLAFPPREEEAVVLDDSPAGPQAGPSDQEPSELVPKSQRTRLPRTLHKPDPQIVRELISAFRAHLPEEVQERHVLDEERVSEDLARYLKKSAIEYVSSLKGRPERSALKVTQKWFAKRKTVRQERKEKRKIKKQIKLEAAEYSENTRLQEDQPVDIPEEAQIEPADPTSSSAGFESKKAIKARLIAEQKAERRLQEQAEAEAREKEKAAKAQVREQEKAAKTLLREQERAAKQAKKEKKKAE